MEDNFLPLAPGSGAITPDIIHSMIEAELNKIIFPDGSKKTIQLECQKLVSPFLTTLYSAEQTHEMFLAEYDRILIENRIRNYHSPVIAWIWLRIVEKLGKPEMNYLLQEMRSISGKRDSL